MKVKILFLSINNSVYDDNVYTDLSLMNYAQALKWAYNDKKHCFTIRECEIDLIRPNEFNEYCDGISVGDRTDTMFVYVKVFE